MTAMRIIDLQRRLREIGRIRTGDTTVAANGKSRPRKLERFRLTSSDRRVIDAAAQVWGGDVTEWQAPDGPQWQVYIAADEIPVVVPPGDMSFSQSYEQWTAGGCKVRCDGQWDHIGDQACHCDPTDRACAIHTRLSVMVPDLPGIGVWRLETHSYYAAVELGGLVDLCAAQAAAGVMIPARLRLEQRSVKRINVKTGKPQTNRFAVPVLDLDVHPLQLGAGQQAGQVGPGAVAALAAGPPSITPVPEPERVLRPSVAAQVDAVSDETTRESRQASVPRTGLKPRTVAERQAAEPAPAEPPPMPPSAGTLCSVCDESYQDGRPVRRGRDSESLYVHTEHDRPTETADNGAVETHQTPPEALNVRTVAARAGRVFRADYEAAPRGAKTKVVERLRHALTWAVTGCTKSSLNDLTGDELVEVWYRLEDVNAGRITYQADPIDDHGGVIFTTTTGKTATVLWSEFEQAPA